MKTILTILDNKDSTELKFDNSSFFRTIRRVSPREKVCNDGTYKKDKMIYITTIELT